MGIQAHVVIGVDGEVFAVLTSMRPIHLEAEYGVFQGRLSRLMDNPTAPEASLTRDQALSVLAGADYTKELDPDAESFVAWLKIEHGMDQLEHETFTFSN